MATTDCGKNQPHYEDRRAIVAARRRVYEYSIRIRHSCASKRNPAIARNFAASATVAFAILFDATRSHRLLVQLRRPQGAARNAAAALPKRRLYEATSIADADYFSAPLNAAANSSTYTSIKAPIYCTGTFIETFLSLVRPKADES